MFSIHTTAGINNNARLEDSLRRAEQDLVGYLNISSIEEIELGKMEVRRYLQRELSGEEASNLRQRIERKLFGDNPTNEQLGELYNKLDTLRASIKS